MIQGITPAISAVRSLGERIRNTANNVSNVSTQGYKKSRSTAASLPTYSVATASGTDQVGRGSTLGDISQIFQQGAFERADSPTSMAIGGDGFFIVRDPDGGSYYTREGDFHFDQKGSLVNSSGYVVQGWKIDPATSAPQGAIGNISATLFTSPPRETTMVTQIVNLDAASANHSAGTNGLSAAWNGESPDGRPIADRNYAYQATVTVYDSLGAAHDVTIYFDKGENEGSWEYMVTVNPAEDQRPQAAGENKGLLARGELKFNNSGQFTDMTMEQNNGDGSWSPADASADLVNGHFAFQADFSGGGAPPMTVALDFGAAYNGNNWAMTEPSSTQFAAPSHTVFSASDGYHAGELVSISVGADGVITGSYSNGDLVDLFQVATARFRNPNGLQQLGNNLYAETGDSGAALTGSPGSGGFGGIVPQALESSNVDLVEEFAALTLFQRHFEANLKVIEVENTLKGDVINLIS
ncbi:MAG: flagellar hook protein FlgE [Thermodesulfobacteriota bacterium]